MCVIEGLSRITRKLQKRDQDDNKFLFQTEKTSSVFFIRHYSSLKMSFTEPHHQDVQ